MQTIAPTLRRLVLEPAEFWLSQIVPTFSLDEVRAEVVAVVDETHDMKTFVLAPNRRFRGHLAGQYVPVDVTIDGVRVRRCYSISSAPHDKRLAITVKRVPGGRVSTHLHQRVRRGEVLVLGQALGQFTLPARVDTPLLLLSGGSGVTPVMSMLRELSRRDAVSDVVFLHAARSQRDVPFTRELAVLSERHRGLRVVYHLDDQHGRLDPSSLVPDFATRRTFLCGPTGLMDAVTRSYESAGVAHRLELERFASAPYASVGTGGAKVTLSRSGRTLRTLGSGTLLEELERGGERPAHGCRMGICNTCRCRKVSGLVEDARTGAVSDAPDEEIRLCTSIVRSDLELAL